MKERRGSLLAHTLMMMLLFLSGFTVWVMGQSRQQQARHLVIMNWTRRQEALRFLMANPEAPVMPQNTTNYPAVIERDELKEVVLVAENHRIVMPRYRPVKP